MPSKTDTKKLSRELGRKPFEDLDFKNNHAKCPFHNGDTDTSLSIKQGDDGVWRITCFSECKQSWDPISYVMKRRGVQFRDAIRILGGKDDAEGQSNAPVAATTKSKPKAMTIEAWESYGRELTAADVARFAKSRKDKTASFDTFKALGCRVKDDFLAFPHFRTVYDSGMGESNVEFYAVKLRHLDQKDFEQEHVSSSKHFFNLDTVSVLEDVYVVEGEPDVAVMEEAGFHAVSVVSGSQKKFSKDALKTLDLAPRIFLVGDQGEDDPGQGCMDALQKQDILAPEKTFRIRFENAHDVCALARKTGENFASYIENLRDDSLEPWVTENLPRIHELTKEPVRWVVERMIPYGCVTMLTAAKGSMKSLFAEALSQAISGGHSTFLGRQVGKPWPPVLYLDRENPEAVVSERARLSGILGNNDFIYWLDKHKGEPTPELDDPRLLEFARRKNGFVVIDSLQDWYGDENENDNSAMVKLIKKIQRLARAGSGVLVIHHLNAEGTKARGGTSIVAMADFAMKVAKKEAQPNVLELREDRFRMCEGWEMDFQAHWDAGEFHDRQKHYQFEVLRDQLVSDVISGKRNEALAEDNAERGRVADAIENNPTNAPTTLAGKVGMDRKKFLRLAGQLKKFYSTDSKSWISQN